MQCTRLAVLSLCRTRRYSQATPIRTYKPELERSFSLSCCAEIVALVIFVVAVAIEASSAVALAVQPE